MIVAERDGSPDIMLTFIGKWFDGAAVMASTLCLAHCLLVPVIIAVSPALAAMLNFSESFHIGVVLTAIPISAIALISGYRIHGVSGPAFKGFIGLSLLTIAALFATSENMEILLTVAGSVVLVIAHLRNSSLYHRMTGRFSH